MKKMFTLFVFVLTLCSLSLTSYANTYAYAGSAEIKGAGILRFQNITTASCYININNSGVAELNATLSALGCEKTAITCNLQQNNNGYWSTMETFSKENNNVFCVLSGSKKVTKGYTYRVEAIFTATRDGVSESTTLYYEASY